MPVFRVERNKGCTVRSNYHPRDKSPCRLKSLRSYPQFCWFEYRQGFCTLFSVSFTQMAKTAPDRAAFVDFWGCGPHFSDRDVSYSAEYPYLSMAASRLWPCLHRGHSSGE